ncbi:SDR family NAD(P)-dependent oxidoreductase [Polyangium fumosum]|uniref:SDR family NAD(P)-dependent oxidoreductase n=1 Tax=Polyangium fumosum TaxID=889272 RepID=A0A4U1J7Q0_9BACT|nr:SDR family NAD(P)-dependent oxidoreductase [Polyangium fumosum]TKD03218.1 SDR family NAD(P)-dependent oxidoreductase [Polyangium fumosum]
MDLHLKDKRALVTGSSSGIGAEVARFLAREGVAVVVHGRNAERAQAVADEITTRGGRAAIALGDLSTAEGLDHVIDAAARAFGGIDILVNNAGGATNVAHASWFDAPLEEWLDEYRSNTLPAVRLVQAFVPGMRERRWGRVIQISSRNAISPHAQLAAYGASKAALNNFTLSLSKALAGTGVTSNGIMPGLIYTPALDGWFREIAAKQGLTEPAEGRAWVLKNAVHQTVDRLGVPADIAEAVCFLASPLTDFMTGTTFRIDGGATPTV